MGGLRIRCGFSNFMKFEVLFFECLLRKDIVISGFLTFFRHKTLRSRYSMNWKSP